MLNHDELIKAKKMYLEAINQTAESIQKNKSNPKLLSSFSLVLNDLLFRLNELEPLFIKEEKEQKYDHQRPSQTLC